ncbi:arsenate reductase/protein-tyrosine-phosphatase family protein [Demequina mangrovi]|uniref:Low molecular weight phosphotyrosine protein phosphatase n=1 Tax=Demequina mangrovi TaxID=1043493 RepID=A0A1H6YFK0_9MICO|nr:hypothetical protein [Demequina mangrovi]SEJ40073.1 Low molecular weight phosphotyrosine protein phosphatase [Demequina mangrovi]
MLAPLIDTRMRVLIVDHDNRGRSAAGERLLRHHLARHGVPAERIRVTSAGLDAADGELMLDVVRDEIERLGANADGFRTRSLSGAIVDGADLIVTGTKAEWEQLVRVYPHVARRAFTLSELAHLYDGAVRAAPLAEHATMLARRRDASPGLPLDFDLPPVQDAEIHVAVLGARIDEACAWVADMWSALLPAGASPAEPTGEAMVLDAFGVRVAVDFAGADVAPMVLRASRMWSRCVVEPMDDAAAEVALRVTVDSDPKVLAAARARGELAYPDMGHALHLLTSAITVRAIERRVGGPVLLHAAGVAAPSGDVVGFVAPSGTGKTTLARTLGAHYGYVTDETLAVYEGRVVKPYPKPLSVLRAPPHTLKEEWGPESLDLVPTPTRHLRLARLILIERDIYADRPALEEVPLLEGLAHLAEQVSYLARLPMKLHTLADLAESVGGIARLRYREARDIIPLMPQLLGEAG